MANVEAAQKLRELADTQASLRRLAVLIASGAAPETVFAAVTEEALRHFGGGTARTIRYELDGSATLVANQGTTGPHVRVGERWEEYPATGLTATVLRTGRAARVDDYRDVTGGEPYWREGLSSAVGMPIHVNGRLWGMIAVGSGCGPLPPDTEQRMTELTDLLATAVASAQSRAELSASRARIVAASDEARRRIERDLHDGAQQRLIGLVLRLRTAAEASVQADDARTEIANVATELLEVIDDLREMSRGIHPAILSEKGLLPALRDLARRSAVAVDVHVRLVRVRDDGVGGAQPAGGSGLTGLRDRVEALGGTFALHSPAGRGTTIWCELPTTLGPGIPGLAFHSVNEATPRNPDSRPGNF